MTSDVTNRPKASIVGRGAHGNPANRFDRIVCEDDFAQLADDESTTARRVATQYIADDSQSIVSSNNSPDLSFRYSLNPYRGCSHGCSYCYARTYHEFLGMSGGLDFETKLLYKPEAPELFRDWLNRRGWRGECITLSGGTDCYQGVERDFELTRQCLEVALEFRQPIAIVTKNVLVLRDLDLLKQMAEQELVRVNLSITSLDQELIRHMEPRTSSPSARLRALGELVEAGIPTCALISPIIPGLNDIEIPRLLEAVARAGGTAARYTMLRLPGVVEEVFLSWLERELPHKAALVESRIRQIRGGELNDSRFGTRMVGEGELAKQVRQTFNVFAKRYAVDNDLPPLNTSQFLRAGDRRQRRLF